MRVEGSDNVMKKEKEGGETMMRTVHTNVISVLSSPFCTVASLPSVQLCTKQQDPFDSSTALCNMTVLQNYPFLVLVQRGNELEREEA